MTCKYFCKARVRQTVQYRGRMQESAGSALRPYCSHLSSQITEFDIKNRLNAKLNCLGEKERCVINNGEGYTEM